MILDRIENAEAHCTYSDEIALALDYLRRTDFSQAPEGRCDLDGDRVYALVQRYRTKPLTDVKWEAHRKYLDVQYIASGIERMGYAALREDMPVTHAYDPQNDYILYDAAGDFFAIQAGGFAIFGPRDVHAPGLAIGGPETVGDVCKVVVKCRLK